jgi:hypothetical protein
VVGDDSAVTAPLYAIGRFCSRHHYPTIAVWVILAVALVLAGQSQDSKTNDNLTLPGTDSTAATEGEDFFARRDAAAEPVKGK